MKLTRSLANNTTELVEWFGLILLIGIVGWWMKSPPVALVPATKWGVLAALPGLLGLATHFVVVLPRFRACREAVLDYQAFCRGFDVWWLETGWPQKLEQTGYGELAGKSDYRIIVKGGSPNDDDLGSFRPSTIAALAAALILTLVFEIAAKIASLPLNDWSTSGWPIDDKTARQGLLFAALGAFVSVMWRMINRINANALTSRFMFTAALRATIAIVIGMVAAQVDLFGTKTAATDAAASSVKEALFFFIGLFTDWALTSIRARARTVFNQPNDPCDRLPLCFVDGLDDGVIDILDELGIWDVQHLATSEPGELTIRTLCPFNRIIDWIDQAILISYIRRNIADARLFGITGAIDLAVLFSYTVGQTTPFKSRAEAILDDLSKKIGMSRSAIDLTCSNLYFDYTVEQLYRFWQHLRKDEENPPVTA